MRQKEVKLRELVSGLSGSSFKLSLLETVKWRGELFSKGFLMKCSQTVMLPDFLLPFTT